jgi:hypothetical protein
MRTSNFPGNIKEHQTFMTEILLLTNLFGASAKVLVDWITNENCWLFYSRQLDVSDYSTHIKFSNTNARFVISGPLRTKLPDYLSHVKIIGYFH